MSKIYFKSHKQKADSFFNGNKLVIETGSDTGLYIQTFMDDKFTLAWVYLKKSEVLDLAARLAYEAQFLEDDDDE